MGSYAEVFYHFVWATKGREPYLTTRIEPLVHEYIRSKCKTLNVTMHAVNGLPDHVHLACSLPLSLSPAEFLKQIKGGSAYFINHKPELRDNCQVCLYWQPGAGVLTYAARDLPRIVGYINNQKNRHAAGRTTAKLECCDDSDAASPYDAIAHPDS